jgi:hypothetical protein
MAHILRWQKYARKLVRGEKLSLLLQKIKFAEMNKTFSTETQEDRYFLIIVLSIFKINRTGVFSTYTRIPVLFKQIIVHTRLRVRTETML